MHFVKKGGFFLDTLSKNTYVSCAYAHFFVPLHFVNSMLLFFALCRHVRAYQRWCEENYSSMENIDVQWIVRYLTMLAIAGLSFYFICFCYLPNRMFTQNWVLFLILAYTTEKVLFRPDPIALSRQAEETAPAEENESTQPTISNNGNDVKNDYFAGAKAKLEAYMAQTKPYLNPNFKLMDLRAVLPLNRSYLSQFINTEYGCSFFQYVMHYRIDEAKRLMKEQPAMKLEDIAKCSGFSSASVFSRTFTRETGTTPSAYLASLLKK